MKSKKNVKGFFINVKISCKRISDKILNSNFNKKLINFFRKFKELKINIYLYTILYTIFTIIVYNIFVFKKLFVATKDFSDLATLTLTMISIFNILFTLFFQRLLTKFFSILFIMINANILYFMVTYNAVIDRTMIINVLETNINETLELLNLRYLLHISIFGLVPSIIIYNIKIIYSRSIIKEILLKIGISILSLACGLFFVFIDYKEISSTLRKNRDLKYNIIPYNYIDSIYSIIRRNLKHKTFTFSDLTYDVKIDTTTNVNNKKNLIILVVGEAARSENFSLNNYQKKTNEYLEKQDLIFYNNFYSCGTATAISVPCMFSAYTRKDFNFEKRNYTSNLLDFLKKAGFYIYWADNNSDCKGVCERVENYNYSRNYKNSEFCNGKECFDEVLIESLDKKIKNLTNNNNIIVLHQKGSHGPAYYLRYPEKFEKFKPVCKTEIFSECSKEEITNAYNNTLNYTSYFLNEIIEILKNNENNFNVALFYVSDHGQSLGEKGMYLHGAPYLISPIQQRHIPFFIWLSNNFEKEFNIDKKCLLKNSKNEYSHDNLFHSFLGLFNISTKYYIEKLDIFNKCKLAKD